MKGIFDFGVFLPSFLLVFLRVSLILLLFPIYGNKSLPVQFKIGLVIVLTLIIYSFLDIKIKLIGLPMLVTKEVAIGLILGFACKSFFFVIEMAGQLISSSMGLSVASIFNPEMGQSTEISRFYSVLAVLIFLSLNGHHDLIYLLVRSYDLIPLGGAEFGKIFDVSKEMVQKMLMFSIKIASPVILLMLITNIYLAFISKAAPQMNIFFIGYPVYLFVGFLTILMGIPVFILLMQEGFTNLRFDLEKILFALRG